MSIDDDLAAQVRNYLSSLGFALEDDRIQPPPKQDKDCVRRLHADAVRANRDRAESILAPYEQAFIDELLPGNMLRVDAIQPYLQPVKKTDTFNTRLFRWIELHWSIPVSNGYGRRLRFIVRDRGHQSRIIGIIGLSDPVYSVGSRDSWIGWSPEQRRVGLVGIMDAYVLGAVEPYSQLAGGKLVALLSLTNEITDAHFRKYSNSKTLILGRERTLPLTLVTTTSALGRSSIYNRLKDSTQSTAYHPLGFTAGTGDFHFSGNIYAQLRLAAESATGSTDSSRNPQWQGSGYRNRRETIRRGLRALGFQPDALRIHGIKRQTFGAPLAHNWRQILQGSNENPHYLTRTVATETEWWLARWARARAATTTSFETFEPETYRLYPPARDPLSTPICPACSRQNDIHTIADDYLTN